METQNFVLCYYEHNPIFSVTPNNNRSNCVCMDSVKHESTCRICVCVDVSQLLPHCFITAGFHFNLFLSSFVFYSLSMRRCINWLLWSLWKTEIIDLWLDWSSFYIYILVVTEKNWSLNLFNGKQFYYSELKVKDSTLKNNINL